MSMKKSMAVFAVFSAMLFILAAGASAAGNIVISEVLYDPVLSETNGEAVELYNPTANDMDISSYVIKTESSAADAVLPAGSIIPAGGYFLIADTGWSAGKDDASWPDADYEEAITLTNTNAGVALLDSAGMTIDAVGWGNASEIGSGLYEGMPAAHVASGKSLARIALQDTNNNAADFAESLPDFQNADSVNGGAEDQTEGTDLTINAVVAGSAPLISGISMTDDAPSTPAPEVNPVPGANKSVVLNVNASDENGAADITDVKAVVSLGGFTRNVQLTKKSDIGSLAAAFSGSLEMNYFDLPGHYIVNITAEDSSGQSTSSLSAFDYAGMTAISIDTTAMSFPGIIPGQSSDIAGDANTATAGNPTLKNIGNTAFNVGLYGTDLVNGVAVIPVNRLQYSLNNFASVSSFAKSVADTGSLLDINSISSFSLRLNVPVGTSSGSYTGGATIVALPQ